MGKRCATVLGTVLVALAVAGCYDWAFRTNGDTATMVSPERLEELRRGWSAGTWARISKSTIDIRYQQWSLDFIATYESLSATPCMQLDLLDLRAVELQRITGKGPDGRPLEFQPMSYNEVWTVDACGIRREWRVFDEATDYRDRHRVILVRSQAAPS